MDDLSFSKKANISVINRFDQQVKDIIMSASQVALYVFDAKKTEWIKRNVEGACFFYKRKTSPRYGIFILNRLDTNNFIELMNSTMDLQLQEPFILYRNVFKTIYGIWFYDKKECTAMASVFQQSLVELKEKEKAEQVEDNVDSVMKDKISTTERILDQDKLFGKENETSNGQVDSVRQFFAKASKEATKNQPGLQASPAQQANCKKSLCNSFQSVAHIENKQKSDNLSFQPLVTSLRDNEYLARRNNELSKSDINYDKSVHVIENNFKSLGVSNQFESSPVNFLEKFSQASAFKDDVNSVDSEFPELIPPRMLITPSELSASVQKTDPLAVDADSHVKLKNEMLSKTQMVQAMEYLLKNDSQFTDKLYDAYLKSIKK